ncbi:hypothetical protein ACSFA7_29405 [Variovorax sp. LT1R20]
MAGDAASILAYGRATRMGRGLQADLSLQAAWLLRFAFAFSKAM